MADQTVTISGTIGGWEATPHAPVLNAGDTLTFDNQISVQICILFNANLPCLTIAANGSGKVTVPSSACLTYTVSESCTGEETGSTPPGRIHIGS